VLELLTRDQRLRPKTSQTSVHYGESACGAERSGQGSRTLTMAAVGDGGAAAAAALGGRRRWTFARLDFGC
jgi:hypothetical protein